MYSVVQVQPQPHRAFLKPNPDDDKMLFSVFRDSQHALKTRRGVIELQSEEADMYGIWETF